MAVYIEKEYKGARADVVYEEKNVTIAFEISITTTEENELSNTKKDLAVFDKVVLCFDNRKKLEKYRKYILSNINEKDRDRIRFTVLGEFLNNNKTLLEDFI